jgi:hypothetical protein
MQCRNAAKPTTQSGGGRNEQINVQLKSTSQNDRTSELARLFKKKRHISSRVDSTSGAHALGARLRKTRVNATASASEKRADGRLMQYDGEEITDFAGQIDDTTSIQRA